MWQAAAGPARVSLAATWTCAMRPRAHSRRALSPRRRQGGEANRGPSSSSRAISPSRYVRPSFWAVRRQAPAADPWGRPDMLQYRRKRSQGFLPPETQPTAGNAAKAARLQRPPSNKAPWLVRLQHARCACCRKCIEHKCTTRGLTSPLAAFRPMR